MKDQEFIELLNLYLDHEITANDARRLEEEVRANPARREVYLDYCRMQKACGVLAEQFVHQRASEHFAMAASKQETDRAGAAWVAFGSLAAVAAGVGLALLLGGRRTIAPAAPTETVASAATVSGSSAGRPGVVIASMSASDLRAPLAREATVTPPSSDSLEWVRSFQVQATPTMPEPTRFEPAPDLFRHDLRALPTSGGSAPAAESAAFRFQR